MVKKGEQILLLGIAVLGALIGQLVQRIPVELTAILCVIVAWAVWAIINTSKKN